MKGFIYGRNCRNGTSPKTLKTSMGPVDINSPRDRDGSFSPQIVPKRTTDVSSIEGKILSMYAKGLSTRDISAITDRTCSVLTTELLLHSGLRNDWDFC